MRICRSIIIPLNHFLMRPIDFLFKVFKSRKCLFKLVSNQYSLIIKDDLLKCCKFKPRKTLAIPMNERDLTGQKTEKSRFSSSIRTNETKAISLRNRDVRIS